MVYIDSTTLFSVFVTVSSVAMKVEFGTSSKGYLSVVLMRRALNDRIARAVAAYGRGGDNWRIRRNGRVLLLQLSDRNA